MIIDKNLLLSDAQAFAATAVSTNSVDLGAANLEVGTGEEIGIGMAVGVTAFASGTYVLEALSDDVNTLASPTVLATRTILAAALTAGSLHFLEIPIGTPIERYIGARLTLGGTTPTITADLFVTSRRMFSKIAKSYPKNYAT